MALSLFAVLIALLLCYWLPQLSRLRDDRWFRTWAERMGDTAGPARIAIVLAVPVGVCALISLLLASAIMLSVAWLAFAVVVLCYCLGPGDLDREIDAVTQAPDAMRRDEALQALCGETPLTWHAAAVVAATFFSALRRRFGVLFWFFALGPAGALLYRLAQALARDQHIDLDARTRSGARHLADALDWLPAHLMVFAMALVSDFDAVLHAWKQWHASPNRVRGQLDPGFLAAVAHAGVDADIEAGDGFAEDISDPLEELRDARRVLHRVLAVWLAVVAVLVLVGWAA
jgi:AmpE protein